MNNGIYAATTGMLARSKALNVIGNNLTNSNTAAYKKDKLLYTDFGNGPTFNFDKKPFVLGETNHGTISSGIYTSYEQGTFAATGSSLDFAIKGEGFFTLTQANGAVALTRDGQFNIDADGFLVDSSGSFVMGKNGKIKADTPDFKVGANGDVFINDEYIDTLLITVPQNTNNLRKLSNGMVSNAANSAEFKGSVWQGAIENSNIDIADEMTDMIAQSRAYQACSQIIKQMDKIMQKTVNEIGRV